MLSYTPCSRLCMLMVYSRLTTSAAAVRVGRFLSLAFFTMAEASYWGRVWTGCEEGVGGKRLACADDYADGVRSRRVEEEGSSEDNQSRADRLIVIVVVVVVGVRVFVCGSAWFIALSSSSFLLNQSYSTLKTISICAV